jgi:hypothetical protein
VQAANCTGLDALNPVCQLGSLGGSLASSGFESVLSGISQWVASGAEWLLGQIGAVLTSTTTVDLGATWFRAHYEQMTALAGVVILPLLLVSTLQAVLRQNPGQLVHTFLVQLPLALLLAVVAIQIVILSLAATDAMSVAVAGGTGSDVTSMLSTLTTGLIAAAGDPSVAGFVLLLVSLLIAVAAFVLWLELLIRAAAVYVAVLFLPLALATLVWPAVSHWCKRLVETLSALILSKFVIVATLSLAAGAVTAGTSHGAGFSAVLAGGALLVMATFAPFAILRLIPAIEAGAVGHLEGLRQRGTAALTGLPRSAAGHVLNEGLQMLGDARLLAQAGPVGTAAGVGASALRAGSFGRTSGGAEQGPTAPGKVAREPEHDAESGSDIVGRNGETLDELLDQVTPENGGLVNRADGRAVGDPESQRIFDDALARGAVSPPRGPKPIIEKKPSAAVGDRGTEPSTSSPSLPETRRPGTYPLRPEDAWKWDGVPEGCGLVGPVEPGKMRHYIGYDDHGPQLRWLPPAWPPGEGPPASSDGGGPGGAGTE